MKTVVSLPDSESAYALPTTSCVGFLTSNSNDVWNLTSLGKVKTTLSPSFTGISSGIVIFSYFTLKALYFPAPSDWSTVTFGLVTVISEPSLVTLVGSADTPSETLLVSVVGVSLTSVVLVFGSVDATVVVEVLAVEVSDVVLTVLSVVDTPTSVTLGSLVVETSSASTF